MYIKLVEFKQSGGHLLIISQCKYDFVDITRYFILTFQRFTSKTYVKIQKQYLYRILFFIFFLISVTLIGC